MPADDWYQGWFQSDWFFANDTVESFIKSRSFNKNLAYMSGVTTQEAAYMLCKYTEKDVTNPERELAIFTSFVHVRMRVLISIKK